MFFKSSVSADIANESYIMLKEKWHHMLGHVNFDHLDVLCKKELLKRALMLESGMLKCEIHSENKMNKSFKALMRVVWKVPGLTGDSAATLD